jgi:hypothetical protein
MSQLIMQVIHLWKSNVNFLSNSNLLKQNILINISYQNCMQFFFDS